MGNSSNKNQKGNLLISSYTHPNKPDWITKHAAVLEMSLVEVDRLWKRFLILGANDDGYISAELADQLASQDVFMRNIISTMRGDDMSISFQGFLQAMKWFEATATPLEERIKASFSVLNKGAPVPNDLMKLVLSRMFPHYNENQIRTLNDKVMEALDPRHSGLINQETFVSYVMSLRRDAVEDLLYFDILPPHVDERMLEIQDAISGVAPDMKSVEARPFSSPAKRVPLISKGPELVTPDMLRFVARRVINRDWLMLGNQLGFLTDDIAAFVRESPDETEQQVFSMLQAWAKANKRKATVESLQGALHRANMSDVALEIHPQITGKTAPVVPDLHHYPEGYQEPSQQPYNAQAPAPSHAQTAASVQETSKNTSTKSTKHKKKTSFFGSKRKEEPAPRPSYSP